MTGGSERGNFVSEWFGYRTYPRVGGGDAAIRIQKSGRCPFLSSAIHEERDCVKSTSSSGVCTINNASNGTRQDWLVCPYRALDPALLEDVVRRLFGATVSQPVRVAPAPTLTRAVTREEILEQVGNRELVVARYALEDAPNQAFSEDGSGGAVVAAIHRRLSAWWPELAA